MSKVKHTLVALALGLGLTLISLVLFAGADSSAQAPITSDSPALHSASSLSTLDPTSPTLPVRLVFIHHSTGGIWLADDYGGLGLALRDNNYFVSATNYGWGPDTIGDRTDIGNWWEWFRGPNSATYLAALYAESEKNVGDFGDYSRLATNPDPTGENEIIMFKSCFPNSLLKGSLSDPVPPIDSNLLRGQNANSEYHTVANAKGIYIDLLNYFRTRPDKLFVVIAASPVSDDYYADNARAFNNWLVNDWLSGYPLNNVAVFDYYNVLTTNGGDANTNDLGWTTGNHHRWWNNAIQHKTNDGSNVLAYPTEDDHPSQAGDQKATAEFLPLLNIFYHQWKAGASEKKVSDTNPFYGQMITYTIVMRDLSAPPTVTIYLTDIVPTGLSYVPGSLTATGGIVTSTATPTLRWSGSLTPTPSVTVTYAVTVSATASEAITNSAVIVAPGYQTITRSATVLTRGSSALSNAKNTVLTHDPAWPGDRITYTIAVRNTGSADAVDVHITDTLPSPVIGANVDVTYTIAAGDAVTITVPATVTNDVPWGATITNTAYYQHSAGSGSADVTFTIVGPPQLNITKSVAQARDPVQPRDRITYTIVVRNTGSADAAGVHITDTLPSQVIGANVDVTYTIAAGDAVTITVPATVTSNAPWGATVANTAYYQHSTRSGSANAVFTIVGPPQLSITKSVTLVGSSGLLGQPIIYSIALSNTGTGMATGVVMTDALPAALDFGGWVEQSGAIQDGDTITWTGDVGAATQVAMIFTTTLGTNPLLYGQTIINTAYFGSADAQRGSASVAFAIPAPDLSRSAKEVSTVTVKAGELVTYTIILSNTGSLNANVRYTDTLPAELEWVSGDLTGTVEVNAEESVKIIISARVKMDVKDYVFFHNSVDINDGYHPVLTRNSHDTAVGAFRIYLPLVANEISNQSGSEEGPVKGTS